MSLLFISLDAIEECALCGGELTNGFLTDPGREVVCPKCVAEVAEYKIRHFLWVRSLGKGKKKA